MTKQELLTWPEVYKDFMMVLKPVVDTRGGDAILHITGIPLGMLYEAISSKHGYSLEQVRELGDNLRRGDYVHVDNLGFFVPTGKGEDLIRALSDAYVTSSVPPLPDAG